MVNHGNNSSMMVIANIKVNNGMDDINKINMVNNGINNDNGIKDNKDNSMVVNNLGNNKIIKDNNSIKINNDINNIIIKDNMLNNHINNNNTIQISIWQLVLVVNLPIMIQINGKGHKDMHHKHKVHSIGHQINLHEINKIQMVIQLRTYHVD